MYIIADSDRAMAAFHCSHRLGRKMATVGLLGRMGDGVNSRLSLYRNFANLSLTLNL